MDPEPIPEPEPAPGPHQVRGVWEDTRNPYDHGLRRNWVELCCGRLGGVPPDKSPALVRDSDEEAMLPSRPADHGRAGLGGAAEASRLEQGKGGGAAYGSAMGKGLAAGHDGQEMLPMAAPQPLPVADEGRAALPGGGSGGDDGGEASEDWENLELERRAMLERGEAKSGD